MEEANVFSESSKMLLSFFTNSGLLEVKTAQKYRVSKSTILPPASCQAGEQPHPWSSCSSLQGRRWKALSGRLPFQSQPPLSAWYPHGCPAFYESPRV